MTTNAHNLNAHLLGTGEFSFAEGATTLAAARAIGMRDMGNMLTYSIQPKNTKVDHKGSYRGIKRIDKTRTTESQLLYQFKLDEWHMQNMLFVYYGEEAGALTQTIKAGVTGDNLDFTTVFNKGYWYDVTVSGVRIRKMTAATLALQATPVATQGEADTDLFTTVAHGLLNGDQVILAATGGIAGFAINTPYYVVNKTADTFQLSLTLGGTPILFATDGTGTTYKQVLKINVDYELDLEAGRVRFLTVQSTLIYLLVTAPAITLNDPGSMRLITPLTTTKRSGIGRLMLFDDKTGAQMATEHDGFGCELTMTGNADGGADTFSDFVLECLVTSPVGVVGIREVAAGTE